MKLDNLSEEDLAHMTPEERAAQDYDDSEDGLATDRDDNAAAETPAEAAAAAASEAAATAEPSQEPAFANIEQEVPALRAEVPANAREHIAALDQKASENFKQWSAGNLDDDAYLAENARIQAERDEVTAALIRAETYRDMNAQATQRAWEQACITFAATIKASEGIDYRTNPVLQAAFDSQVKALAADAGNADKSATFFLTTAHQKVKEAFGAIGVKPAAPAAASAPAPASAAGRRPDLSAVPPSIARAPVATEGAVAQDEFTAVRAMKGAALEQHIARMDPATLARYMASDD